MTARYLFFVFGLASTVLAADREWAWLDRWESPYVERFWRYPPSGLPAEPLLDVRFPEFLYVCFEGPDTHGITATFLHPIRKRRDAYQALHKPSHQSSAEAYGYELIQISPEGYEVVFQRIDPVSGAPLPYRPLTKFFPRGRRTLIALSACIQVTGFYGDPTLTAPPWLAGLRSTQLPHGR